MAKHIKSAYNRVVDLKKGNETLLQHTLQDMEILRMSVQAAKIQSRALQESVLRAHSRQSFHQRYSVLTH